MYPLLTLGLSRSDPREVTPAHAYAGFVRSQTSCRKSLQEYDLWVKRTTDQKHLLIIWFSFESQGARCISRHPVYSLTGACAVQSKFCNTKEYKDRDRGESTLLNHGCIVESSRFQFSPSKKCRCGTPKIVLGSETQHAAGTRKTYRIIC